MCQAARVWYQVLDTALTEIGFKRLIADQVVWIKREPAGAEQKYGSLICKNYRL